MIIRTLIFIVINFGALAIESIFTSSGVPSDWYVNLNKAPWTPPGWMFGLAWSVIMIALSIYMANAWNNSNNKVLLIVLFLMQLVLNIAWNPVFFKYHYVLLALVIISLLTIVVMYILFAYMNQFKAWTFLLVPYATWLFIACSLNMYIYIKN